MLQSLGPRPARQPALPEAQATPPLLEHERARINSELLGIQRQIDSLNSQSERRCDQLHRGLIPPQWGSSGMPATYNSNIGQHAWSADVVVAGMEDQIKELSGRKRALRAQLSGTPAPDRYEYSPAQEQSSEAELRGVLSRCLDDGRVDALTSIRNKGTVPNPGSIMGVTYYAGPDGWDLLIRDAQSNRERLQKHQDAKQPSHRGY